MHRPRTNPVLAAALLFGLAASVPSRAQADTGTDAAAQLLYDQGTAAMDKGDYATGCPKLEEVVRLKPDGVGAKLTLAQCYEGAGRLATAWAAYAAAESAAANAGQADRAKNAAAKAQALKGRLATFTIVVPQALREADGLEVQRDDVPIGAALWGVPVPVDQGRHSITVYAADHKRWDRQLEVRDGEHPTLTIALGDTKTALPAVTPVARPRPSPPKPPVATPLAMPPAEPPPPAEEPPAPPEQPSRSWAVPGVALGVAAAGLGAMGVAGGLLMSTKSTIAQECPGKVCTQAGLDAVSTGQTLNIVGSVGFGVGVAGLVGFVTWLAWPSSKPSAEAARVLPAVAPGYAGLQVGSPF